MSDADIVLSKEGILVINGRRAKPLWLSGLQFPFPGNGIVCFEARGTSDIGVFFSSTPEEVHEDDQVSATESCQRAEYEVVIGSYCNKKSVIRKRGVLRAFSTTGVGNSIEQSATYARHSFDKSWTFEKYWIGIKDGVIIAGKGTVGSCVFLKWEDSEPLKGSFHVGVSSWHQPVVFRFFEVFPAIEGLITSREDNISSVNNFFLVARNYFSNCFHDICLESSDGSLFPCHGCVISFWSDRLKDAVDKAIHSNPSYKRGSKANLGHLVTKKSLLTGRVENNGMKKVYFMKTSSWNEQCTPSVVETFEDIPSILLRASTSASAMFVQMLYGVGLGKKPFYRMESDGGTLNLSEYDQQTWEECKALVEEWQVSFLTYIFEEQILSDFGNVSDSNSSNLLPEYYSDTFVNNFVHYLNYLMDSLFLSDVELILPLEEEPKVAVHNAVFTYSNDLNDNRNTSFSFRAHRLVLASASSYFLKMFSSGMKEMLQQKIQISHVNVSSFQRMLNEIYQKTDYGMARLDEDDVYLWLDYLNDVKVGDMFSVVRFKREACNSLRSLLNASNVIHLANLSLECELFDLFQAATDFICFHFDEVSKGTDFTFLHEDCFLHILSRMDLEVQEENVVALAVLKWLDENNHSSSVAQDLFSMIRQKLVDPSILNDIKEKHNICECFESLEISSRQSATNSEITLHNDRKDEDWNIANVESSNNFTNDNDISEVFEQPRSIIFESFQFVKLEPAKWIPTEFTFKIHEEKWLLLKKEWNKIYGNIPRVAPGEVWIPYIPKLHSSGVLYYLSCLYGLQLGGTRVNPLKYDIVKITSSSGSRFAKLEGLAESWINRCSFALPSSSSLVWFALDLGDERRLACSFYTLAHDGSESNFLRNWCLEGSKDGINWVLLKEHQNDITLQFPMQRATWRIEEPASQEFYRHFRVLARPPCKQINLGNFEFYGRLRMKWKT